MYNWSQVKLNRVAIIFTARNLNWNGIIFKKRVRSDNSHCVVRRT
jgi:hypothetical protein